MRSLHFTLTILVLSSSASAALRETPLCGTFPGRGRLEVAKHRFFEGRRDAGRGRPLRVAARFEIVGDLIVMNDDGTVISEANPFDLHVRSLEFGKRGERAYRVRSGGEPLEAALGERVVIGDDQTRAFELAFAFPFFDRVYQRVYLNSDGNLTFDRGDRESTPRSLERFLTGPARIALFFSDLNPGEGGEVRVASTPDRFTVTWDAVPEFGTENQNTFQLELRPDGTIAMRYGGVVDAASGIVGLSPGNDPAEIALVDLGGEMREIAGAIVERFQRGRMIDNVGLARAFYHEFPDRYDALVLWTDFESDLDNAFAFASPVSNQVDGIGDDVFDDSAVWGSSGELESFVFMGDLRRYPRDPHARVFGAASRPTTLGLLSHEIGHRWLARARVFRTGTPTTVLLGRQSSHWSFFFDSDASFLEGNEIVQEEERRFRTAETVARYSRLDLYLMGLAAAAEVPPFFVVTEATASAPLGDINHESPPRVGVAITGTRTDLTMDDVELALGRRQPGFESSQKTFRHAWILLVQRDKWPSAEDVARLQEFRNAFVPFFNEMTLGRGHLEIAVSP